MALTAYQTQTQALLQNPGAPTTLYSTTDITRWINMARGQIAGESACIRALVALNTINAQNSYGFTTGFTIAVTGVQGILNVRQITGSSMLSARPWEWFFQYYLALGGTGTPTDWAQIAQGVSGVIYLSPTPNGVFNLTVDTVCYPIDLVNDSTAEAIPYPWTDCIPYFAAYLALLSAQTSSRMGDADRMFALYEKFMARARQMSTSAVLPFQYEQSGLHVPVPAGGVQLNSGAT